MEGDSAVPAAASLAHISIHSLRMEGDTEEFSVAEMGDEISIHSLRMEGDLLLIRTAA